MNTERAVRGIFAATLCLEALTVLFVPRALAGSDGGLTRTRLIILLVLAAALLAAAALQGRSFGLVLGTALQLAVIASGVLTSAMYVLGVIFAAIWVYELRIRAQLLRR